MKYFSDVAGFINELLEWEKPAAAYKRLLAECSSGISIHYRGIGLAKKCLQLIETNIGDTASRSILENDKGCLLKLSDVIQFITVDSSWTWEKEEFPEIVGVASSEWLE
jgi:hypothetical protein